MQYILIMKTSSYLKKSDEESLVDYVKNMAGNSKLKCDKSLSADGNDNFAMNDVSNSTSIINNIQSDVNVNKITWGTEWDALEHNDGIFGTNFTDKLTVVITTYKQPICLERMLLLMQSCPAVAEIRVNWFEDEDPKLVKTYLPSDERPVIFDKQPNKISYRFHPRKFRTDAVFSVDVDTYYSCESLTKALDTFNQYKGQNRVVGFHGRFMRTNQLYRSATSYLSPKFRYNTVFVTKGGILHKDMFDEFFSDEYKVLREKVDEAFTAEDMLMSFIMDVKKMKILFTCPEVHSLCHVFCTQGTIRPLSKRSSADRQAILDLFVEFFGRDKVFRNKFEGKDNIIWQKGEPQDSCKSIINYDFENTPPCTNFCKENLICPSNVGATKK